MKQIPLSLAGVAPVGSFKFTEINSVAELKAINTSDNGYNIPFLENGSVAEVSGYFAKNDGGGGVFVFDAYSAAADDGGITIAPTQGDGRWIRQTFGQRINAKWFGAVGDDATNSTDALQDAIDYCTANGLELFIPAGIYRYNSLALNFENDKGLKISGCSNGDYTPATSGTVLRTTAANGNAIVVDGFAGQAFLTIESVNFYGNANVDKGLKLLRATNITLSNCVFRSFTKAASAAVYLTRGVGEFTGVINFNECRWELCYTGVLVDKPDTNVVNFFRCQWLDCTTYAFQNGSVDTESGMRSVNFIGCLFEGNTVGDIFSGGGLHACVIQGCYFEQNNAASNGARITITGSAFSEFTTGVVISGNTFSKDLPNAGDSLILLKNVEGVAIEGNWSAFGGEADRWFVYAQENISKARIEPLAVVFTGAPAWPVSLIQGTFYGTATDLSVRDFSPQFAASGSGNNTTVRNSAKYTKIGSLVHCDFDITLSVKDGASVGYFYITGLPFYARAPGVVLFSEITGVEATYMPMRGYVALNTNYIQVLRNSDGTPFDFTAFVALNARIKGTLTYQTYE